MKETPAPRDERVTDDAERGERSRDGYADADDKRNPIPPSEQGPQRQQDPKSGRARDPELGEPGL